MTAKFRAVYARPRVTDPLLSPGAGRWILLAVFVATYAAIAARRLSLLPLGRPAAALVGACALVVVGRLCGGVGLAPEAAFGAVELHTIVLLFGMMVLTAGLDVGGFFERTTRFTLARVRSPVALLDLVTLGAGVLSAVLVNDAVCLLATPLVAGIVRRAKLPLRPYLFALAMGSNAGSAMTLSGNPQNMLVARLSGLSYRRYLATGGAGGFAALLVTAAILHLMFARQLRAAGTVSASPSASPSVPPPPRDALFVAGVITAFGLVVAEIAGVHLAGGAITAAAVMLVVARDRAPRLLERVDWSILVFFGSLFVVVAALRQTGLVDESIAVVAPLLPAGGVAGAAALALVLAVGSQVVTNVPLILLLEPLMRSRPDPAAAWILTALVTTLAGNLTLLGSVANVIVIEQAHAQDDIGFVAYLKVGAVVTIASIAVALPVTLALAAALPR